MSEIQVMDASKRTTGANAYVAGLGASKRIVIYDNLLRDFTRAEQLNIIAHELGHEHYDDVRNGLLYVAIVAPFGMLARGAARTRRFATREPRHARRAARARAVDPARLHRHQLDLELALAPGRGARGLASRCATTNAPDALIALQRRLVIRNVSDPDPPDWRDRGLRHAPAADGPDRDGAGLPRATRRLARLDLVGVVAVALVEVGEPHPDVAVL